MKVGALVILATAVTFAWGQNLGDFPRAQGEHETDVVDQPFVVTSVSGRVCVRVEPSIALPDVLIEIQGPGSGRKIRRTRTDENGRFKIRHLPKGEYRFKASLHTWQGVLGRIVVSRAAPQKSEIVIRMNPGT